MSDILKQSNLEFKAFCLNPDHLSSNLAKVGLISTSYVQTDNYLACERGFLKLRNYLDRYELIWYDRLTSPVIRESSYIKISLTSLDSKTAADLLKAELRKHGTVTKRRQQYRAEGFIINIDRVSDVGDFVEVEIFDGHETKTDFVGGIKDLIGISDEQIIPYSNIHLLNMFRSARRYAERQTDSGAMLFVDGGSATGKTTVRNSLVSKHGFEFARRDTTRAPRGDPGSDDDYRFVTNAEFRERAVSGEYIEFRDFLFGMSYGLPWEAFTEKVQAGNRVLALINLGSGLLVKKLFPAARTILLVASEADIRQRLHARGTMKPEQIEERVENALLSRKLAGGYDLVLDTSAMPAQRVIEEILKQLP